MFQIHINHYINSVSSEIFIFNKVTNSCVCLMSCQELKFQQSRKKGKASETRSSSHSLSRRACVSLVSPLCSGGAVSTSSMADPASLPLAAVSVSASNSRHSTRKRTSPSQQSKSQAKRPRTRSQDTAAPRDHSTTGDAAAQAGRRGRDKHAPSTSCSSEALERRSSLRNSRPFDKDHLDAKTTVLNNKVLHNSHYNLSLTAKNKASVSLIESSSTETHRKPTYKRPQSTGSVKLNNSESETSKLRRSTKAEPGTSHWDINTSKKSRLNKSKESKSVDAESSFHKYPLRSQGRLNTADNPDRNIPDQLQHSNKASAINKKKHKVIY